MRSFRLTLAYDGTDYAGWQVQPRERTVQGVLEKALCRITGCESRVVASGRTDAGVHARGQVCSFRSDTELTPEVLRRALDATTPSDLEVLEVVVAADGFHAIRDAIGKRYRYTIQDGTCYDLFTRRYAWRVRRRLDVDAMRSAARHLIGRHDFSSFEAAGAPRKTSVRTVRELDIARQLDEMGDSVIIEVEADGFLYNMVRNFVGSLVKVGCGGRPPDWISDVLATLDRKAAGPTAPAHGLMLLQVDYGLGRGRAAAKEQSDS